jgi:hypothetical protein
MVKRGTMRWLAKRWRPMWLHVWRWTPCESVWTWQKVRWRRRRRRIISVAMVHHPLMVRQRLVVGCIVVVCLRVAEHVRKWRRWRWQRRRKVVVPWGVWWSEWSWGLRRGRRWRAKLVLKGAPILLSTVEAGGLERQGIRVPRIAHAGACGAACERVLGGNAISTRGGLGVGDVSGRGCDWSAVGDAVPS